MNPIRLRPEALAAALLLGSLIVASGALAQVAPVAEPAGRTTDTSIELRAGASYSDNVRRAPTDEDSGVIPTAGVGLDVAHDGRRFDLTAQGDLEWRRYPNNFFDDDVFGQLDGRASLALAPEVLLWNLEETFGRLERDPFATNTPANEERVNYLTTGPHLNLRLGGSTRLALDVSYSTIDYDLSDLDSDRYGGLIALVHGFSDSNSLSLNASGQRFEFDNPALESYEQRQYFLRYLSRVRRGSLSAELGYATLEQEGADSDGVLARLRLERRLTAATSLNLYASQRFADAGDLFRDGIDRGAAGPRPVLATADAFEERTIGLRWSFSRGRTGLDVAFERGRERYEHDLASNRTLDNFELNYERRMTPMMTLRASARHERQEFDTLDFDARFTSLSAALERRLGRKLGVELSYRRYDRQSSDPLTEYTEQQVGLNLLYRPLGR